MWVPHLWNWTVASRAAAFWGDARNRYPEGWNWMSMGGSLGTPRCSCKETGTTVSGAGFPKLPPAHITPRTLMSRRKLAEKRDIWIFSRRENCCRIPPADSTVEALEY